MWLWLLKAWEYPDNAKFKYNKTKTLKLFESFKICENQL